MTRPATPPPRRGRVLPGRRGPFREMDDVHRRMGQLLEGFFGDLPPVGGIEQPPVWVPVAEVVERGDEFVIELELPGVRSEDVDLELRDTRLRVSGAAVERRDRGLVRRKGRRNGAFEYVVTLPGEADPERVGSSLDAGILTVRVGKAPAGPARPGPPG